MASTKEPKCYVLLGPKGRVKAATRRRAMACLLISAALVGGFVGYAAHIISRSL